MSTVSLVRQAANGYPSSPEESLYSNHNTTTLAAHLRPIPTRRETDQILSYYQSELAGRSYVSSDGLDNDIALPPLVRKSSSASRSSSEYSSDLPDHRVDGPSHLDSSATAGKQPPVATRHTRRPSVPSEGGADRRRLAIVELDPTLQSSSDSKQSQRRRDATMERGAPNGILNRRGVHVDGLALVAPPDASPMSYTDLTPPSSAPTAADRASTLPHPTLHQRSISEAVNGVGKAGLHHKSSRDVGIVGIAVTASESSSSTSTTTSTTTSDDFQNYAENEGLRPPVFQTPGRSPATTPGATTPELSDSGEYQYSSTSLTTPSYHDQEGMLTPAIGEHKDIQRPVVGPVVVGLSQDMMRPNPNRTNSTVSAPTPAPPARPTPSPNYFSHNAASPYLFYEPGKHSTAGPLPPPPQLVPAVTSPTPASTAPPPRPPRLFTPLPTGSKRNIDALKEALQLPQSVSAALASRLPLDSAQNPGSDPLPNPAAPLHQDNTSPPASTLRPSKSIHTREGAFPPSTIYTSPPSVLGQVSQAVIDSAKTTNLTRDDSPVLVEVPGKENNEQESSSSLSSISLAHTLQAPPRRTALELHRESSWVSLGKDASARPMSPNGGTESTPSSPTSSSPLRSPPVPPKNGRTSEDERSSSTAPSAFKATFTNLKRFSALPRTPSFTSTTKIPSPHTSRTPSPPTLPLSKPKPKPPTSRLRSAWPDALQFNDVVAKKSALERSLGYAQKINELALYDCGLAEWVLSVKHRGSYPRSMQGSAMQVMVTPATPSVRTHTTQPRHTSHGSLASEATFPTRADAYTATDLSVRYSEVAMSSVQHPALPYPALAQSSRTLPMRSSSVVNSPSRSLQLPLPGGKSSGQGFFASIGRKSSMKKDKGSSPSTPSRVLTKRAPSSTPVIAAPRPVQVAAAPSVPGGPRAAPSRIQRSQTFSVSPSPLAPEPVPTPSIPHQRQSAAARRPSIFARARAAPSGPVQPAFTPTPEFERQVDKLADLLPHADRTILAGYLRRSGQDILAIGQYLEDEKNGTIRRD
ncbi:hypothetical protein B0H21DRAFT_576427 [Amylocystis lapponica]|nr:hypothetical protein B0H21DRAFT_576427 [Amylocystis lapponica]